MLADPDAAAIRHRRRRGRRPGWQSAVLRHTHATIALSERIPLHLVAARLGDDPKTVRDTYAHAAAQVRRGGGCGRGRRAFG
jgi:integrase